MVPGVSDLISRGKFGELKKWLNENIHSKGSLYPSGDELCQTVTGEPLNPKYFLTYLQEKYAELYKL